MMWASDSRCLIMTIRMEQTQDRHKGDPTLISGCCKVWTISERAGKNPATSQLQSFEMKGSWHCCAGSVPSAESFKSCINEVTALGKAGESQSVWTWGSGRAIAVTVKRLQFRFESSLPWDSSANGILVAYCRLQASRAHLHRISFQKRLILYISSTFMLTLMLFGYRI